MEEIKETTQQTFTPYTDENGNSVSMDGNSYVATAPGFVNIQESPVGFGGTPGEALADLQKSLARLPAETEEEEEEDLGNGADQPDADGTEDGAEDGSTVVESPNTATGTAPKPRLGTVENKHGHHKHPGIDKQNKTDTINSGRIT
jgi:hypothetical protein